MPEPPAAADGEPPAPAATGWAAGEFAVFDDAAAEASVTGSARATVSALVNEQGGGGGALPLHTVYLDTVVDGVADLGGGAADGPDGAEPAAAGEPQPQSLLVYCQGPAVVCVLFNLEASAAAKAAAEAAATPAPAPQPAPKASRGAGQAAGEAQAEAMKAAMPTITVADVDQTPIGAAMPVRPLRALLFLRRLAPR